MTESRSRQALYEFLDYLAKKGMLNSNTAAARKAAANKVFGILDEVEASDLSAIDFEGVVQRFVNLEGKNYTTDSLITYKSRAKSALDDFLVYVENPMGFRLPAGRSSKKSPDKTEAGDRKVKVDRQPVSPVVGPNRAQPSDISIPIPIREGLIVHVTGIPFDLSEAEATKIANVVKAMVF